MEYEVIISQGKTWEAGYQTGKFKNPGSRQYVQRFYDFGKTEHEGGNLKTKD
jgi:hypothetical protein